MKNLHGQKANPVMNFTNLREFSLFTLKICADRRRAANKNPKVIDPSVWHSRQQVKLIIVYWITPTQMTSNFLGMENVLYIRTSLIGGLS